MISSAATPAPTADPNNPTPTGLSVIEPVYTVQELAQTWKLSVDTIRALFAGEPDVIVIQASRKRGTRIYRTVRVPESVVRRVWTRLQQRHRNN